MRLRRGADSEALKDTVAELSAVVADLKSFARPARGAVGQRLDELERRVAALEERLDVEPRGGTELAAAVVESEIAVDGVYEEEAQPYHELQAASPEGTDADEPGADPGLAQGRAARAARLMERTAGGAADVEEVADGDEPADADTSEAPPDTTLGAEKLARARRKQRLAQRRAERRGVPEEEDDGDGSGA